MSGGSTTLAANNIEQVNKKILEAFVAGNSSYESTFENTFRIREPERKDERFAIVKTDSGVTETADGGAYPIQDVREIGVNQISQKVYKSAIAIGDLTEAFQANTQVEQTAMTRGYDFKNKIDQLCVNFLDNSTSTTAPYGITIDGGTYALVGTTQPVGDTGTTQSNRVSSLLAKDSINLARIRMRKMKDHNGRIAGLRPKRLVTPSEEVMNAWQLTFSPNEPESANNNLNYVKTLGISIIENPLLSDTQGCYLLADQSIVGARGLLLLVKEMPTMRRVRNDETGNWNYQMRMILNAGVSDYYGVVSIGV